jgi:ferredoxin
MIIQYGYTDATGEYYISINTDNCNGCEDCVNACPGNLLEMTIDDYDNTVVKIRDEVVKTIGFLCPGNQTGQREDSCHVACKAACPFDVFQHSW